jgi:hypothetical protein
VIDEKLATRLFAEAHYADYQPLIESVREAILKCSRHHGKLPQWLEMTCDLERRFLRHGVTFTKVNPAGPTLTN